MPSFAPPRFLLGIAGLLFALPPVHAQTYSWTAAADGNWNSTGWTLSGTKGVGPPPAVADATFTIGGANYTVSVTDSRSIHNLTLNSTKVTLATGGSLAVNGTFTLDNGTVDNSGGGLTLNGGFTWSGGTVGGGTVTASNGGTITGGTITGATMNLDKGTYSWSASAINFNSGGTLIVGSGATLSSVTNNGFAVGTSTTGVVQNNGTIEKVGGTSNAVLDTGLTLNNSGTFRVTSGGWSVAGGATFNNNGTLNIGSAAVFSPNGGTVNLNNGSAVTGTGLFNLNSSSAVVTVTGTVNMEGGLDYIRGLINGTGTLNVGGAFNFGLFDSNSLTGITLNAGGGGTWTGTGTPHIGTATVNLTGGTTTWGGNGILFTAGGTLTIANGATLNLIDDHGFAVNAGNPTVTINGTFEKTGGASNITILPSISFSIGSTGLFDIQSGTVIMQPNAVNNGVIRVGSGATYEFNTGVTQTGSGTVNVLSGGAFIARPSGAITATLGSGTLTNNGTVQALTGTLLIDPSVNVTNFTPATSTLSGGTWLANSTLDMGGRVIGTLASGTTVELSGTNATMTGLSNLTQNNGALRIYNGATLTPSGGTLNNAGLLEVSGTLASALNVQSGGALAGKGTVTGAVTVQQGGTVAPGPGPYLANGTSVLTVGGLTMHSGSSIAWELNSWTATPTAGTQYDQLKGSSGTKLDLTGVSSANPIVLQIGSLSDSTTAGEITKFDGSVSRSWVVANFATGNASGGIVGFSVNKFTIDTSNFANAPNTTGFSLSVDAASNNLILTYSPVPEPAAVLGIATLAGLVGLRFRRTRSAR